MDDFEVSVCMVRYRTTTKQRICQLRINSSPSNKHEHTHIYTHTHIHNMPANSALQYRQNYDVSCDTGLTFEKLQVEIGIPVKQMSMLTILLQARGLYQRSKHSSGGMNLESIHSNNKVILPSISHERAPRMIQSKKL